MEQFLLLSHVVCGATVLLLGLVQMLNKKGRKNHNLIGRIYVGAMWWICLSAWGIIMFYRFSAFLMVIAILTFHSSFTGVRIFRRMRTGHEQWYDRLVAWASLLFGVGLLGYSGYIGIASSNYILALLCVFFGLFTVNAGYQDLKFFIRKPKVERSWWLKQHIGAMGGSYIAAITAFAVQNPNLFMPDSSYQWLLWIFPAAIGSPLISIATKKWAA